MPIPTVSGSEIVSAPYAAAPLDVNALMAPGRAMVGVAQSIGYAGQVIGEFAERKQRAINAAAEQDAMMQMEKGFDDYQIELSTQQDEEKWVEGWKKKSETLKSSLLSDPHISQAVKDHLTVALNTEAERSTQRIATQANTRLLQRQKARLMNVADYMFQRGDIERGDIAIEAMSEHGLIFPEQEFELKKDGHEKADFSAVNKGINVDPFTTIDQLDEKTPSGEWKNFTNLDENRREGLKVEAIRRTAALRADTVQGIVDRRNQGEIISKDELQSLVDSRRLKPTEMRWVLQEQSRSGTDAGMAVAFAKALSAVDAYDPTKDPTNEQYAALFGQSVQFSPQYRDEIQRRLQKQKNPTFEEHATRDAKAYIDHLLAGGFLGDISKSTDGKPTSPTEYQTAYGKTIELRQALDGFMRQNPKATPVEQRDFLNGKIQTERSVRAATPILNAVVGAATRTAPISITTKAQFDNLPAGQTFEFNGRVGRKAAK